MAATVAKALPSILLPSLDDVRTQSAKADLRTPSVSITACVVVKDALARHYGSLKAAAITLGYDPSQLSRDLDRGDFKLKQLDKDEEAKVFVVAALYAAFGTVDQKARVRQLIRDGRRILDELAEAL